jgi:probable HAF family extracellular repeat protein
MRRFLLIGLAFVTVLVLPLAARSAGSSWTLTNLGTLPGGHYSSAVAISNSGQIVGSSETANGMSHAFVWRNGRMTDLGTLGGPESQATALNDRGQVVGDSYVSGGGWHAFVWWNGRMTDLGTTAAGAFSSAAAINGAGQIVGLGDTDTTPGPYHALLWDNGKLTDLGTLGGTVSNATAINNSGQIIGNSHTADGYTHAFLWQRGVMTDLGTLGGTDSTAAAINERGEIVGSSNTGTGEMHAFVWWRGRMTDLGTLGACQSYASGINGRGQVIGVCRGFAATTAAFTTLGRQTILVPPSQEAVHAFVWDRGVMTDLGTLGGKETVPYAINESGKIVGYSKTATGELHAFAWQDQPGRVRGGLMTDLGPGLASAINNRGQIAGSVYGGPSSNTAALWTP